MLFSWSECQSNQLEKRKKAKPIFHQVRMQGAFKMLQNISYPNMQQNRIMIVILILLTLTIHSRFCMLLGFKFTCKLLQLYSFQAPYYFKSFNNTFIFNYNYPVIFLSSLFIFQNTEIDQQNQTKNVLRTLLAKIVIPFSFFLSSSYFQESLICFFSSLLKAKCHHLYSKVKKFTKAKILK